MKKNEAGKDKEKIGEPTFEELEKLTRPEGGESGFVAGADAGPVEMPGQQQAIDRVTVASEIVGERMAHSVDKAGRLMDEAMAKEFLGEGVIRQRRVDPAFDALAAVDTLRAEMYQMISALRAEISKSGILDGEFMVATFRGTMYCPVCQIMLDGGSATGIADTPYVHPFAGSPKLQGRQCELIGREFEKPRALTRLMPDKRKKVTPQPAAPALTA